MTVVDERIQSRRRNTDVCPPPSRFRGAQHWSCARLGGTEEAREEGSAFIYSTTEGPVLGVGHVDELGMNTAQDESPAQQRKGLNRRWGVWEADTQNGRSKREGVSEAQDPSVRTADDTPTPEPCCELEGVDRKGRKAAPTGTTTLSAQTSQNTMRAVAPVTGMDLPKSAAWEPTKSISPGEGPGWGRGAPGV